MVQAYGSPAQFNRPRQSRPPHKAYPEAIRDGGGEVSCHSSRPALRQGHQVLQPVPPELPALEEHLHECGW